MDEISIQPAGDAAFMVDTGDRIDVDLNARLHAIVAAARDALAGESRPEITPAYAALLVSFDPESSDATVVEQALRQVVASARPTAHTGRRFTIPTCYGGAHGPDLDEVARLHDLSPETVIDLHTARDYPIYCLGFSPGFPFLGDLHPSLATPRLETPRPRVPVGSVAIDGSQTGVYPSETPGGWRLIGRTPLLLFDITRTPPVPYRPGDIIRFESITVAANDHLLNQQRMPRPTVAQL